MLQFQLAIRCFPPQRLLAAIALIAAFGVTSCGGSAGGGPAVVASDPPISDPVPPTGRNLPGPRPGTGPQTYVNFESGQVRPLALSADGQRLYASNTPDARLEIFSTGISLQSLGSVPVGIDPIAVAEAPDGKVWVVNHLSDSISVVDVSLTPARVVKTLMVGDEPRDIVFAGVSRERAFVTTAHRGQNSPVNPALNTPGVGRADVWVFDSTAPGDAPGGQPLKIITLFGDRPRPLAVSPDGLRVYAGIFLSGNRTTSIAPRGFNKPPPATSADGFEQPDTGLVLRSSNGITWFDEAGNDFSGSVPFTLPDYDVFEIDAESLTEVGRFSGVGTILFNIAVNPVSGTLYVSNLDSRNHVRFAGPATRATTTVRGHVSDQQLTVIEPGSVRRRNLNKHIDFGNQTGSQAERDLSLSLPLDMTVSADGATLFVTAFGSSRLTIFDTAEIEDDSFVPTASDQIVISGGGPSGVVLDEANNRAFVLTRFDNGISTIDLATKREISHINMFSPEPIEITGGRRFLYDARNTSGNGNDSCASCHIFGDTDGLAWDLGEPDGEVKPIPNVFIPTSPSGLPRRFHPMKGPMATQSMRGLRGHGPMHWRGDRTGDNRVDGETLEEAAFKEFNDAFDAFGGLGGKVDDADMQAFTDFAMRISYPPNPIRRLDNQLEGIQLRGEQQFEQGVVRIQTGLLEVCIDCHTLSPARGLFGTAGLSSNNAQTGEKNFKIPHFRDQYQKVGMFGFGFNDTPATGPQVRGFSFNHNGATSSNFIIADLGMPRSDLLALRAFLYAFPTESPPITGQQVTLSNENLADASPKIDLLVERALVETPIPECDLVATGAISNVSYGWLMQADGTFRPDRQADVAISRSDLQQLISGPDDYLSFMCTPWGSGLRMGIDRDLDGILNGDET